MNWNKFTCFDHYLVVVLKCLKYQNIFRIIADYIRFILQSKGFEFHLAECWKREKTMKMTFCFSNEHKRYHNNKNKTYTYISLARIPLTCYNNAADHI